MRPGLQAHILIKAAEGQGRAQRKGLESFYVGRTAPPKRKDQVDAVTKSVERLIESGLMVGYGIRTKKKWFIKEMRLTPAGRKLAQTILSRQQSLPLRRSRSGESQ
jgi:hypothetical protein